MQIDAALFTRMRISILPTFGNPNLAANVGVNSAQPLGVDTATTPQYVSTSAIGPDSIVIDANDAAVRTACPRTGTPGATCTLRIAITTSSPAAGFTLLAVADGKRVILPAGTVVSGITQGGGASQYFSFSPAADGADKTATGVKGEVSFTLTGLAGSPALYVSSTSSGSRTPNAEDPTSYCAAYTSPDFTAAANTPAASGGLSAGSSNLALTGAGGQPLVGRISFGPGHPCYCGPSSTGCSYTLGVASSSSADFGFFSLLALDGTSSSAAVPSSSNTPLLYEGVAQEYALKTGSSQAFDFTFVPASVSVDEAVLATVHLTAFATAGTALSAYANLVPAAGPGANVVPGSGSSQYSSSVLDGAGTIVVRRTDAALVSVCGGPSSTAPCRLRVSLVSTSSAAPSSVVINNATVAKPGLYASFSLLAHTAAGAQLTEGAPIVSSVGQGGGQVQLFRYSLVQPTGSLVISATGLSGPVDLLVGISSVPTSMPPTRATAVYRAYSYAPSSNSNAGSATTGGSAVVVLTANDPDVLACTFPCAVVVGVMQGSMNPPEGSSVSGPATPTHFALSVRTRSGAPSALLEGLPSVDGGIVGDSNYYLATLPLTMTGEATSLTLNLRALGVASAVNKVVAAPLGNAVPASVRLFARVTDGTPISATTAQFSSPILSVAPRSSGKANIALPETEAAMTISSTDPAVLAACPATGANAKAVCSVSVMVQVTNADGTTTTVSGADIASAAYSLTAFGSLSSRPLQEGVPITAGVVASPRSKVLAGGPASEVLFHYTLPTGATHAHITLTPLSGAPMASISVNGVAKPNVERVTAEYTLGGLNSQSSISFSAASIPACRQAAAFGASHCTVFIAVSHATIPDAIEPIAEFPITAGGLAVFRLTATSTVLNPLPIGLPSTGRVLGPGDDSTEWFSVTVPAVDPATGNAPTGLVFNLQSTTGGYGVLAVTRDVDATTGAPRLPRPYCGGQGCSLDNVDKLASYWTAQGTYMYRTKLSINDNGDGLFAFPATYYVAVASALPSDFTLSASLVSASGALTADGAPIPAIGHVTLLPGLPFEDFLANTNDETYFKVLVPAPTVANGNDGAYIAIQGAATYGDISISVSLNPANTRPKPIDTTTFATSGGLTGYRVAVPPPSLANCARDASNANMCTLWVTVKATAGPALFTVALQSDPSAQILFPLQEGRVARSAVLQNTHAYFVAQVPLSSPSVPLHFSLSEIQGKCELYVKGLPVTTQGTSMVEPASLPNRIINQGTTSKILGVQTLTLQPGVDAAHPGPGGRVIVAVFGSIDCAFSLAYTVPSTVSRLEDGLTQDGFIGTPGGYAYFMFRPKANPGDIKVSIASATGRAMLFASRWPTAAYNQGFRVNNSGNGGFEMTSAGGGVLTIPGDGSSSTACPLERDDCAYQIAVWCDDAQPMGGPAASACSFVITASTSTGRPLTLVDGTPYRGRVGGFVHRYFTFAAPPPPAETADPAVFTVDMSVETGLAYVLIAPAYLADGITPAPLPTADDPSTYVASSTTDNPSLTFKIPTAPRALTATGPNNAINLKTSRTYYVAVYSLQAPTQFTVSANYATRPLPILTNIMSQGKVLAAGASMSFNLQLLDPTRDMVVLASILYGSITVAVGSRDRVPSCSWATVPGGIASGRAPVCWGAQWQDSSAADNLAAIRVPAANACSSPNLVAGAACDHSAEWRVGSYFITVVAHEDTMFTLTGATSNGFLRALNGVPSIVYQAANGPAGTADFIPPTSILYQALPEPSNPEVRITLAPMSAPLSSNFDFYITSCVDALCTSMHEYPSAANAQLKGRVRAGSRLDVSITKASAAYCMPSGDLASDGLNHVCNYFITLAPTGCTPQQAATGNCNAVATVTATVLSASAAVTLDYPSLGNKLTTLRAEAAPDRTSRFFMFVKGGSRPAADVFLRLELCDSMAGFVTAYLCEEPYAGLSLGDGTAISAINGQPFCSQPKNPNADNNAQLTLSTAADTDGGEGRARMSIIGTRTRQLFAAVTVPSPSANYAKSFARFGASSYEYQVVVGRGWYLKQPTKDGVGSIKIKYDTADRTKATISWLPPLLLNDSAVTGWNPSFAAQTGLTYRIYVAYKSFATAAALATNTTAGLAGIMPTTACGLERWVSLSGKNASVFETSANSITVGGLRVNKPYQVNVVAICDEVCLRANAARRGWPDVTTGLSAQRIPYAVTPVQTPPEPSPLPVDDGYDLSPSTVVSVVAPIGITICALLLIGVVFMFYKQHKRSVVLANAKLGKGPGAAGGATMVAVSSSAGAGPVATIPREAADALFKPREPSVRRALFVPSTPRSMSQFPPQGSGATSVMNPAAGMANAWQQPQQQPAAVPQHQVPASMPIAGAPAADYIAANVDPNRRGRQARGGAPMQEVTAPGGFASPQQPSVHHQQFASGTGVGDAVEITLGSTPQRTPVTQQQPLQQQQHQQPPALPQQSPAAFVDSWSVPEYNGNANVVVNGGTAASNSSNPWE